MCIRGVLYIEVTLYGNSRISEKNNVDGQIQLGIFRLKLQFRIL